MPAWHEQILDQVKGVLSWQDEQDDGLQYDLSY